MLGIGLIGLGRHGSRYAQHLLRGDVEDARLAAFHRRDAVRGAEESRKLGVRYAPTLEQLAGDPDVGALVAVVPTAFHEPIAEIAAGAKKPLLLEKPIARDPEEARRIAAAFARAGAPLMVAQTLRFDPLVQLLEQRASEERFGRLRGFELLHRIEPRRLDSSGPPARSAPPGETAEGGRATRAAGEARVVEHWEEQPHISGGGVLIQTGIHAVDALRFVTKAEHSAVVTAAVSRSPAGRNEDHAVVAIELHGGPLLEGAPPALGVVSASRVGDSRHLSLSLYLERGGLEADLIARTLAEVRGRDRKVISVPEAPTLVAVLRAFAALAEGRGPNLVPADDAIRSLELVTGAYRAAPPQGPPSGAGDASASAVQERAPRK